MGSLANSGRILTAFDLFSGAGGMTLGFKQAGFEVVGAIEVNPLAVETYMMNHPEVIVWTQDIRNVDPQEVMERLGLGVGDLALLGGCPPCQGFSSLRTRNRGRVVADDRNDLVFEFVRFVRALRPHAVMLENVPNLAKDARLSRVIADLTELGYAIDDDSVRILDAADFGVPQHRKRMILLGGRDRRFSFAAPCPRQTTVQQAIGNLPPVGSSNDPLHDAIVKRSERINKLIQAVPRDGGGRKSIPFEFQLACHQGFTGFKDVYGRMAWRRPSPTITSGCFNPSKGRFLHPEEDRAISLREAALLQSFPSDYKFSLRRGRMAVAEQIGNALPPEFIRRHAEQIAVNWETTECPKL